jgi:hypothetical protein
MGPEKTWSLHMLVIRSPNRGEAPTSRSQPPATILWQARLDGLPPSRDEAMEIVLVRGLPKVVKSWAARSWHSASIAELRRQRPDRPFGGALALECRIWANQPVFVPDEAQLAELLERGAVIGSAAQICERHLYAERDDREPRLTLRLLRPAGARS